MADRTLFPPTTLSDIRARGWDAPDFVYVIGDAYVDHPSFGSAIITRTLEAAGYRVAVLAQPGYKNANDFTRFGRPRYGFLVSSGGNSYNYRADLQIYRDQNHWWSCGANRGAQFI